MIGKRSLQRCLKLSLLPVLVLLPVVNGVSAQPVTRVGVIMFDGVLASDVTAPMEVFGSAIAKGTIAGYEVVTIAPEAGVITAHEGIKLVADYGVQNAPDLDVLIVGSRMDMGPILENKDFMEYVREQGSNAKWVASNCSGAYVLAAAGLLDGKKATTYLGGEPWLKLNHPSIDIEMNQTVVVDDGVVTSNGSVVSYQAAFELLRQLEGASAAAKTADSIYYTRLLQKGKQFEG